MTQSEHLRSKLLGRTADLRVVLEDLDSPDADWSEPLCVAEDIVQDAASMMEAKDEEES